MRRDVFSHAFFAAGALLRLGSRLVEMAVMSRRAMSLNFALCGLLRLDY